MNDKHRVCPTCGQLVCVEQASEPEVDWRVFPFVLSIFLAFYVVLSLVVVVPRGHASHMTMSEYWWMVVVVSSVSLALFLLSMFCPSRTAKDAEQNMDAA